MDLVLQKEYKLFFISYNFIGDFMSKLESFKEFVKKHPKLINYVKEGKSTWQKFYEVYDLYGESEDAWKEYLSPAVITGGVGTDLFNYIKNINLDEFQNGINSIQKVLTMLGDITNKNNSKETYKPRPIYKHFED